MTDADQSLTRQVTVVNELGLHARSAARIAELAAQAAHDVCICRDGQPADAKSVIDLLTLACAQGSILTVEITDASDQPVLNQLVALFAEGFGE